MIDEYAIDDDLPDQFIDISHALVNIEEEQQHYFDSPPFDIETETSNKGRFRSKPIREFVYIFALDQSERAEC